MYKSIFIDLDDTVWAFSEGDYLRQYPKMSFILFIIN